MKCENCPAHYDYEIADTGDYDYGCMLGSDPELTYCCRKKEHIEKKLEKQSEAWNDFHANDRLEYETVNVPYYEPTHI